MNFEQWLISIGKSPKTSKNYSGAITGGLSSWALDAGLVKQSLQELGTVNEFLQVCEEVRKLAIYETRNTVGKGMYNAALNIYADYLAEINGNDIERDLNQVFDDPQLTKTEKSTLINARLGQGGFRKSLIDQWGGCAVTGYSDIRILIASHIKPWARADNQERLDPFNGLLLLPNLDKLFDLGFITFEASGAIRMSAELEDGTKLGVHEDLKVGLISQNQHYLAYHREIVFRN